MFPSIRLGDFGVAIKLERGQLVIDQVGTLAFSAPEVLENKPAGLKADIWSLGVILYLLISSSLPFKPYRSTVKTVQTIIDMPSI